MTLRVLALTSAFFVVAAGVSALAQEEVTAPPNRVIYENQSWSAVPAPATKDAAAPGEGATGEAQLLCQLNDDGGLGACLVESQSAEGFGAAARSLAPEFRMTIPEGGLSSVGSGGRWVRFKVAWPSIVTDPLILYQPSHEELLAAIPDRARRRELNGRAVIACTVTVQGRLADCSVAEEQPEDYQFGRAALSVADKYLMVPATRDGFRVEHPVLVPLIFALSPTGLPQSLRQSLPAPSEPPEITAAKATDRLILPEPEWLEQPTEGDMRNAYPERALRLEREGNVELRCKVVEGGRLGACSVTEESPQGVDFRSAALALARRYRMGEEVWIARPGTGEPVEISSEGAVVEFPVNFVLW